MRLSLQHACLMFLSLLILSSCGPSQVNWNATGKWIDLFAQVQQCDKEFLWEIGLNLNQKGATVTGSSYLLFADGDGGLLELPGTFEGIIRENNLKGTSFYKGLTQLEFKFDLTYDAETLKGTFNTTQVSNCGNGSSDRTFGEVRFITEALTPMKPDALEPNNSKAKASTIESNKALDNLTINKGDVDWFKFEIKSTSRVYLELELLSNFPGHAEINPVIPQTASLQTQSDMEPQFNILPVEKILQKGIHYIAITSRLDKTFKGKHTANGRYRLSLIIEELPDSIYEPNDSKEIASLIELAFDEKLYMSRSNTGIPDVDWFRFEMTNTQVLALTINPGSDHGTYFSLQASNGFTVISDLSSDPPMTYEVVLEPGDYFLAIGSSQPDSGFSYQLSLKTFPIPDNAFEPNNSRTQATAITLDFEQTLFLYPGDEDWLKFTLTESQVIGFDVTEVNSDFTFELYQGSTTIFNSSSSIEPIQTRVLGAGDYFLRVFNTYANTSYSLSIAVSPIPDLNYEPNNSFNVAKPVTLPFIQKLALDTQKDEDWFSFVLPNAQLFTIRINKGIFGQVSGEIFNPEGNLLNEFQTGENPIHAFAFEPGIYLVNFFDDTSSGVVFDTTITGEAFSDSEFEPNNKLEDATEVPLGFSNDSLFVVSTNHPTLGDEDWFGFTLDKTTQVAINILTETFVAATLYDGSGEVKSSLVAENDPILPTGNYYIKVSSGSAAKYALSIAAK
jgi:hypothetical protein